MKKDWKLLLDVKGIDVNLPRFDYGTTPMAIAAQKGHMNIVYLLLAMDGISMDGFSPLGRKKKNKKCCKALRRFSLPTLYPSTHLQAM